MSAEIVSVPVVAWTKPPWTVALTVGDTDELALLPAWMFTTPPLEAFANASASVCELASRSTFCVAVTSPLPSLAATTVSVVASESLAATTPMPNVSTEALVESSPLAETWIENAPSSPTLPSAGSMCVEPTDPLSSAIVSALSVADGLISEIEMKPPPSPCESAVARFSEIAVTTRSWLTPVMTSG